MISQYRLNNDFVDTTSSAYPSIYIQNQQNSQNQTSNNKNPQEQTTQSSWAEATAASQPFLQNNSYILARQQLPQSASRTGSITNPNSYRSQFASSNPQTQQKFANYIAQQNYHYLQNQSNNPSPIGTQIVTYPQPLSSIQQQIHSTNASAQQKYPAMYTSPSTNANYSLPIQQQNMPSNQMLYYSQNINKSDYILKEHLQIPTPIQSPQKHKINNTSNSQSSSQGMSLPSISMLSETSRNQNQNSISSNSNNTLNNQMNNSYSDNANSSSTTSADTYNNKDKQDTQNSNPVSPNNNPIELYDQSLNNKPFRCPYPGCTKSYKNRNGLKYHTQHGHQQEELYADLEVCKPFVCTVEGCNKRYKNSNGLKYHLEHSHNIVANGNNNNNNNNNNEDETQNKSQNQQQSQSQQSQQIQQQQQQLQQQQLQQQQQQQYQQQQLQQQQLQQQHLQQQQLQQQQYQQQYQHQQYQQQQQIQFQQQQMQHPAFVQLPLASDGPGYTTM